VFGGSCYLQHDCCSCSLYVHMCVSSHPPSSKHQISAIHSSFQNCVWNLLHGTLLAPGIWWCHLEVKIIGENLCQDPGITLIVAPELQIAMLPKILTHPYRRKQKMSAIYDSGGTGGRYMAVICLPQEILGGVALWLHRYVMGDH
jgi:hypothetical protein